MLRELIVKGGIIMYPLLLCSVIALAVILERAFFFYRLRRSGEGLNERLHAVRLLLAKGDTDKASLLLKGMSGPVAHVLLAGLSAVDNETAMAQVHTAAVEERRKLFGGLSVLDTIVTVAPLLGLLGTVVGILHTFQMLATEPAMANMQAAGKGIAEALITTAAGLVIAIPSLIALNFFISRAETHNETLDREVVEFERGCKDGEVLEAQG